MTTETHVFSIVLSLNKAHVLKSTRRVLFHRATHVVLKIGLDLHVFMIHCSHDTVGGKLVFRISEYVDNEKLLS